MSRRHRPAVLVAMLAAAALVLGACGPSGPNPVREPYPVDTDPSQVDVSEMWLPRSLEGLDVVDPGWDTEAQFADDTYLGARAHDGLVELTAVDVHGDALWAVQRPGGHEGFVVAADGEGPALAVLTDDGADPDGMTASAYDLGTGEPVWGPIEVPGPLHGPGLVFATEEGSEGEDGAVVALDPGTGRVAAPSSDSSQERVIGEFHGTVLVVDADALVARHAGDDAELWRVPLADHGWDASSLSARPEPAHPDGMALLATSDTAGALLDLQTGLLVGEDADGAWLDGPTGTLVVLDGTSLHAYDTEHELLWQLTVGPGTSVETVGGVFVYLRDGDEVRAHNVVTGALAEAYDPQGQGRILVPAHLTFQGAALLPDGGRHLLATIPETPEPVPETAPGD